MGDVINLTLRAGLDADPGRMIFGEDVEDPKGGVFRLTQKLSTDFPDQVFNSPLAETTILGVACGLASYGRRPVFELQFIDFIYPGWNQLVDESRDVALAHVRQVDVPGGDLRAVRRLPARRLALALAGERGGDRAFPGLKVVIPSTPDDAAGLLWTAMHSEDPMLVLLPKHCCGPSASRRSRVRCRSAMRASRAGDGRHAGGVGQHGREIAGGDGHARRRREHRADRPAFDRAVGPRDDRGVGAQDRPAHRGPGRHGELQRRPDDHFAPRGPARHLEALVSPPVLVSRAT